MAKPKHNADQQELPFEVEFLPVVQATGNGTFVVKAGKPMVRLPDITVNKAAQILRTSVSTVHRYIKEGLLGDVKQTKTRAKIRLDRAKVEELAARLKHD